MRSFSTRGVDLPLATTKTCAGGLTTWLAFSKVSCGSCAERPPKARRRALRSSFDDLNALAQTCHAGLNEFAAGLTPETLDRNVRVPWFPDPPCIITAGEAMVQVAMHSQHHRGQCMTRLKDLGGEPKNVDWIIWLWKQKPAPRWS